MKQASKSVVPERIWLARFAKLMVVLTIALIWLGGQVKSHEAGLSVPDWPLTYGENPITYPVSKWTGGIFHEHFHRLWAGGVATLTVVLALWLSLARSRRWLVMLGWAAVAAVILQAVLGGLTVIFKLPVLVSSAHGILAQTFLLMLLLIAHGLSRERRSTKLVPPAGLNRFFVGAMVLVALIYGQLFLGALMRHTESGLAIPDFPAMGGEYLPRFDDAMMAWINDWRMEYSFSNDRGIDLPEVTLGQVVIHFAHRVGGFLVIAAVFLFTWRTWRGGGHPLVLRTLLQLCLLVTAQGTLGVFTIWTAKLPWVTSLHVVTGACVLLMAGLLAIRAWFLASRKEIPHGHASHGSIARARA